jgi:hypothetical protein
MKRLVFVESKDFEVSDEQFKELKRHLAKTKFNLGRKMKGRFSVENILRLHVVEYEN